MAHAIEAQLGGADRSETAMIRTRQAPNQPQNNPNQPQKYLILTFLLSGLLVSSIMSFQSLQFSRLSLLFQSLFGHASDSHLAEAFLLCFTHLLLLLLPTHTSYQYPSPVACLSSCVECSYGGFISIQIALAEPPSWFCPSASFNLPATPAAYSSS